MNESDMKRRLGLVATARDLKYSVGGAYAQKVLEATWHATRLAALTLQLDQEQRRHAKLMDGLEKDAARVEENLRAALEDLEDIR